MYPLSFIVALAALFGVTAAQAEEFRSSDLRAANNPSVQAVNHMGKLVRERTRGRHTIEMLPQATSTDDFTIQHVKRGDLAMARVGIAAFHNLVPAAVVPSLPFVFKSREHQRQCPTVRSARKSSLTWRVRGSSALPSRCGRRRSIGAPTGLKIHGHLRDEPFGQRHLITKDPEGMAIDAIKPIAPTPAYAAQFTMREVIRRIEHLDS